jgi:hypothetical protein
MLRSKLAFVIGGAQKSGTTTLDAIFRQHPQVQMASVKETHFFDDEEKNWESPDYSELDKHFHANDDRLRGEGTPITMYWRPALRRLRGYNLTVRMVLILRDPVARAFSNWRHEFAHGRETMPFSEAIRGGRLRVRDQGTAEGLHRYFAYVERGFYGEQLSYLTGHFPRENIHCEVHEEFFQNRPAGLKRIANFLGIDPFPETVSELHLNQAPGLPCAANLTPEDANYLSDLYRAQISMVEDFFARPIFSWRAAG